MRFGNKLFSLAILLVGLVAVMLVMKYIIEGFATCSITPTSVNAIVSVNGSEYCVSPGASIPGSNTPLANQGDTITITYGGAFNSLITIHYDNGDYTITPKADGSWPRADNIKFVVPAGRIIQRIDVSENTPVSGGLYTWLKGLVSNPGVSGSGFFSGAVPENPFLFTPPSLDSAQVPVQYTVPIYNQTIAPNNDCSTYNDCSC